MAFAAHGYLFKPMAQQGQVIAVHSEEEFEEHCRKGKESGKLIVVDFAASWCPPCVLIAPIFVELAKLHVNIIFLKVDVEILKGIALRFNIKSMPTFVFLKDGEEVDRCVGADKLILGKKLLDLNISAGISVA